jgi:integrase-like protein
VDLRWDQVDFRTATLHVRRAKQGTPSTHPIVGDELRALRRLQREQEPKSPFVFTSERGAPFTSAGFARMIERAGVEAKFGFKPHPHMLRHACGYALANRGHDTRALQAYLGHKNIQHTVRYTELSPTRFKNFWREWAIPAPSTKMAVEANLNVPQEEEPPEEISPAADAAMRKLVELFSDPAIAAQARFRCSIEGQPNSTSCSSRSSMSSSAIIQTVNINAGSEGCVASAWF